MCGVAEDRHRLPEIEKVFFWMREVMTVLFGMLRVKTRLNVKFKDDSERRIGKNGFH